MAGKMRPAFTLMELLIVMLIIAVLAALALTALQGAAEDAKATRTKAIITKIDQLIAQRWDAYRTRAVPIRVPAGMSPQTAAAFRLAAIRDLQRLELPDRKTDVIDPPADIDPRVGLYNYLGSGTAGNPIALQRQYLRKATASWTEVSQGAECLYLIVSTMHDGDKNALDFFMPGEVGDIDGDGMREILDGWGRPIEFLRWAPGYVAANGVQTLQVSPGVASAGAAVADPFDPLKLDPAAFALKPLIMSGGRDKSFDIFTDNAAPVTFHHYCPPATDNNWPRVFAPFGSGVLAGTPMDTDSDGNEWADNITNHWQEP